MNPNFWPGFNHGGPLDLDSDWSGRSSPVDYSRGPVSQLATELERLFGCAPPRRRDVNVWTSEPLPYKRNAPPQSASSSTSVMTSSASGFSLYGSNDAEMLLDRPGSQFQLQPSTTARDTTPFSLYQSATDLLPYHASSFTTPDLPPLHRDALPPPPPPAFSLYRSAMTSSEAPRRSRLDTSLSSTSTGYWSLSEESSPSPSPPVSPASVMSTFSYDVTPPSPPPPTSAPLPPPRPVLFNDPLDDFASNGVDCDLDDIDKIMRRNDLEKNVRSSALGQGRAAELFQSKDTQQQAMLVRARLLAMSREWERNKHNNNSGSKRNKKPPKVCVFCKNNGEQEEVYACHQLKDEAGNVTCPILFTYKCPICGVEGAKAHTLKYCPMSSDAYVDSKALRSTARTAAGKRRFPTH